MSFHGGLIGATTRHGPLRPQATASACLEPVRPRRQPSHLLGLLFGRIANFINGELWGRTGRRCPGPSCLPDRRAVRAPPEPALRSGPGRPRSPRRSCWRLTIARSFRCAWHDARHRITGIFVCRLRGRRASSWSSSASRTPRSVISSGGWLTMGMVLSHADAS
ncbi:MAG: prolipoprotein diacylglyceryl transferase [Rhizobium sp.]|nr:prolipoprotein diacylglyceryl transferase [Rhizobium sp.]